MAARQLRSQGYTVTVGNLGIPAGVISRTFQDLGTQNGRTIGGNFIEQEMPFVRSNADIVTVFAGGNDVNTITAALAPLAGCTKYASQVPSPKATLALITRACGIIGTPTPVGSLQQESADYEQRVAALVHDDDDLLGYVARLETLNLDDDLEDDDDEDDDDAVGGELGEASLTPIDASEVDSDELMAEVERFLRDQPDS